MKKILHIITRMDMGGSAQNTLLTCLKLARKYEMVLICGLSRESAMAGSEIEAVAKRLERAKVHGVRIITIPSLVRRINPVRDLLALYDIGKIVKAEKPDVVHTHTSKAGILGRMAARIAGVPVTIHTPHGHVFYGHFGPILSRIFLWIERFFAHLTDRVIALSEGELNDYVDLSLCPPVKINTIHSGVDIGKFAFASTETGIVAKKRSLGIEARGRIIGFVGWLLPIKGPMHLLRAMKYIWPLYSDANLVFVGKGDLAVELRAEASKLNSNGKVRFLGWRDDINEIIQIFDMLVLPSLNEGMGRVLVEAMAAGKPVVASRVGGIPDLVRHGETGYLVPPANEKALADAIKRLLDSPEKSERMGLQGRKLCEQFSLEAMVAKLDHLYKELLEFQCPLRAPLPGRGFDKPFGDKKTEKEKPRHYG